MDAARTLFVSILLRKFDTILQPARLLSHLFNSRNGNFMGGDDQYNKPSLEYWTVCYIFPVLALLSLGDFKGHFRWWAFSITWVVMIPVLDSLKSRYGFNCSH